MCWATPTIPQKRIDSQYSSQIWKIAKAWWVKEEEKRRKKKEQNQTEEIHSEQVQGLMNLLSVTQIKCKIVNKKESIRIVKVSQLLLETLTIFTLQDWQQSYREVFFYGFGLFNVERVSQDLFENVRSSFQLCRRAEDLVIYTAAGGALIGLVLGVSFLTLAASMFLGALSTAFSRSRLSFDFQRFLQRFPGLYSAIARGLR